MLAPPPAGEKKARGAASEAGEPKKSSKRKKDPKQICGGCGAIVPPCSYPRIGSRTVYGEEITCLECGGRGHHASKCTSPKLCTLCRKTGAGSGRVPCSICGGKRHRATECPSPICRRCRGTGHYESDCLMTGLTPASYILQLEYPGEDLGLIIGRAKPDKPFQVLHVKPGSAAEHARLFVGTVLVSFDGHRVSDEQTLCILVYDLHARGVTEVVIEGIPPVGIQDHPLPAPRMELLPENAQRISSKKTWTDLTEQQHEFVENAPPPIPTPPHFHPMDHRNHRGKTFV
ncbi:hypothetical protein DIPPA_27938 [Diplonema papillatum]|nr:hypothetical protein DIPPA_27938 [Diplonema papillatum]